MLKGKPIWGLGAVALCLTACGTSEPATTGQTTDEGGPVVDCADSQPTDHSATSLAWHIDPLPGPPLLYTTAPDAPQFENAGVWQAPPILISGASAYRCGEFLYQDWLFDDRGAAGVLDPNDPHDATSYLFSNKAGTLTYPTAEDYANNAADLVEFRVKPLSDRTAFRLTLNTLLDPSRVAMTIALGGSEAPVDWPYSAGVVSPARWFLSVKGTDVELLDAANDMTPIAGPAVTIDMVRRQYTIDVPHTAWNPGTGSVRMAAGVGVWDAEAGTYAQPGAIANASAPGGGATLSPALFNVAFRAQEPTPDFGAFMGRTIADAAVLDKTQAHWWRERAQADALQSGDISAFFANVDFDKLQRGESDESAVPTSGHLNRIYASRFAYGQGLDYENCGGISTARPCQGGMRGQLLPYAIYVPQQAPPADGYGLTVFPHALSANYNQYSGSRHSEQLGERGTGSIVITGSGRGPDGFYYDAAQADIFEVWADAARHYPLDPDRVTMTGISMGGIGSFRTATHYPDLFGRIMPVVAAAGGSEDALASLRNVPVMMWTCALDELQQLPITEEIVGALHGLNYRLDSYLFTTWDHLTPSTNDFYAPGAEFLLDDTVDRNPAHITYVFRPGETNADYGLVADKAYWLSGLELSDASTGIGTIDAVSEGLGLADPEPLPVAESVGVLDGGNHEPAPYVRRALDWVEPATQPAADRLHITASNIARVIVHPERAGLSCGAEIVIDSDVETVVVVDGC